MTRRWARSPSSPSVSVSVAVRGRSDSRTWRERRPDVRGCYVTDPREHPEPELDNALKAPQGVRELAGTAIPADAARQNPDSASDEARRD